MRIFFLYSLFLISFPGLPSPGFSFPEKRCSEEWQKNLSPADYIFEKSTHITYRDYYQLLKRNSCFKEWSVFIYIAADNDLSNFAKADIYEMEAIGSGPEMDIIVEADFSDKRGSRRFHIQKSPGPFINRPDGFFTNLRPEDAFSPVVETLQERDSGNIHGLYDFLSFAATHYPSKHYMIIIWSHGQGWAARKTVNHISELSNPEAFRSIFSNTTPFGESIMGGLAFDYTSGSHFTIPEIRNTLETFSVLYNNCDPIDIYGSDACHMQMAEVVYELRNSVRFVIGSAQPEDFRGWPYREIFKFLESHTTLSEEDRAIFGSGSDSAYIVAKEIPIIYKKSYYDENSTQGFNPKATMSTIRVENFKTPTSIRTGGIPLYSLSGHLDRFAFELYSYLEKDPQGTLRLEHSLKESISHSPMAIDLYYFTALFMASFREKPAPDGIYTKNLERAATNLQDTIRSASISYAYGRHFEEEMTPAIKVFSIWIPGSAGDLEIYRNIFSLSALYKDMEKSGNYWLKVFDKLYDENNIFDEFKVLQ